MTEYYDILPGAGIGGQAGVAYLIDSGQLHLLPEEGWVKGWEIRRFFLRNGIYADYLAADISCRLCSERLRDILERCKSEKDVLQWLDAEVESETGEKKRYYLLHFPEPEDLLDKSKCAYYKTTLLKHVIDMKASAGHEVFSYIGGSTVSFIATQKVREELKNAGCSGLIYLRFSHEKKSYLAKLVRTLWNINKERILNIVKGMKKPGRHNIDWKKLKDLNLPDDLIDFLSRNKSLCYDERKCTVGHVELVTTESLLSGRVYVEPDKESEKKGCYTIPAVDLVAECEGFDAWGILVWLPVIQMFGTWDSNHRQLRVFEKAGWSDIVKKPTKYLNALWKPEEVENVVLLPNNEYPFIEEGGN